MTIYDITGDGTNCHSGGCKLLEGLLRFRRRGSAAAYQHKVPSATAHEPARGLQTKPGQSARNEIGCIGVQHRWREI